MTSAGPPGGPGKGSGTEPTKPIAKGPTGGSRILASALGGLERETPDEKESRDELVRTTDAERVRRQRETRALFWRGWSSGGGVFVEESAWKHTWDYNEEYDEVTAFALRKLKVNSDATLVDWLYAQPRDRFVIGRRSADELDFAVYLAGTSGPYVAGVLRRAEHLEDSTQGDIVFSVYVLHVGRGGVQ